MEAALGSSEAVRAARQALGEGDGVWIVGGAVRDSLLGREVVDVDLACVPGREHEVAKAVARAAGGPAFELSSEFGTWRAISRAGWHVDVTRLRGDGIEDDLRLRDFTANAIAAPLGGGDLIDPTGGARDIEARVLRAASPRAFEDDPLRLLRAARLAASLRFELDPATVELARATAPRAAEPAGERRLEELRLLIGGPDPLRGLEMLDEIGATPGVLPELEALKGVEQNPNHHLDVHGHTLEVLRWTLEVERDLGQYAGESAERVSALLAEDLADGFTRGTALRLGALMHDAGKPATKGEHSGYVTFIGHDEVGARIVGEALGRLKASRALTRHVQGLTRHHLHLGFLVHERPLSKRAIYRYLDRCGDVAPDVTLLTAADRLSARGSGAVAAPEMIKAHLELVREVLPAALDWHRDGPPQLPVRGDDLAQELGIERGPRLGELIGQLREAAYAGEITGREETLALARRLLASE